MSWRLFPSCVSYMSFHPRTFNFLFSSLYDATTNDRSPFHIPRFLHSLVRLCVCVCVRVR
jgi:hypothetical protein